MPRKEREAFHMPFVAGVGTDIPLRPDLMDIGYGNMDNKGRSMYFYL